MKRVKVTIELHPQQHRALVAEAIAHGVTEEELVRDIVCDHFPMEA